MRCYQVSFSRYSLCPHTKMFPPLKITENCTQLKRIIGKDFRVEWNKCITSLCFRIEQFIGWLGHVTNDNFYFNIIFDCIDCTNWGKNESNVKLKITFIDLSVLFSSPEHINLLFQFAFIIEFILWSEKRGGCKTYSAHGMTIQFESLPWQRSFQLD